MTWDYIQPSDVSNGKKAGRAYCGYNNGEVEWNVGGFIYSADVVATDQKPSLCNRWLNPTDYPTWTMSFEIYRTTASDSNEFVMRLENHDAAPELTWNYTTGVLSNADGTLGTLAVETWGTITIRYDWTNSKVYMKLDSGSEVESSVSATYYTSGIYFYKWENTNRIRNIVWDMDRPTNDGKCYLMKVDGFADDYLMLANTLDIYLISGGAHKIATVDSVKCLKKNATALRVQTWPWTGVRIHKFKYRSTSTDGGALGYYNGASAFDYIFKVYNNYWNKGSGTADPIQIDGGNASFSINTWYDVELEIDIPNDRARLKLNDGNWSDYWTISAIDLTPVSLFIYGGTDWLLGNITVDDADGWTTPTIDSPADIEMTEGDPETITWSITGDGGTYSIEQDSVEVDSGSWVADGDTIEFDCSGLSVDIFNIECIITDDIDIVSDTVVVTVASGFVPDNLVSAAGVETGPNVIGKKVKFRINKLNREPDNIHKRYQKFRKRW